MVLAQHLVHGSKVFNKSLGHFIFLRILFNSSDLFWKIFKIVHLVVTSKFGSIHRFSRLSLMWFSVKLDFVDMAVIFELCIASLHVSCQPGSIKS